MNDADGRSASEQSWNQLYEAALLELDRACSPKNCGRSEGDWRTSLGTAPRKRAQPFREGGIGRCPCSLRRFEENPANC
jgi:hypothetical protein